MSRYPSQWSSSGIQRPALRIPPQLIIGVVIALVSLIGYCAKQTVNPVTGRKQAVSMTPQQEVAMGLSHAPEMIRQMGGLSRDAKAAAFVKAVGQKIVSRLPPNSGDYVYDFHLLADPQTVNAFALPGGQVFLTEALLSRLETEGQLAGVLGHEVGHVVGRHSAERMAKAKLSQGIVTGVAVGTSGEGGSGRAGGMLASTIANYIGLSYSRDHELESDYLGLRFMFAAGYDPRSLIGVMKILEQASGGRGNTPDFAATHPNPDRRIERIEAHIAELFPNGVPSGLKR